MPSNVRDAIDFAPQRIATTHSHAPIPLARLDSNHAAATPIDRPPLARRREPTGQPLPVHRRDSAAGSHVRRMKRRLEVAIARTTPTLLPDLLRTFSRRASDLASHPVNAFDNNPFIMSEWLIVSQVLHAAAQTLERRFDVLFLDPQDAA